MTLGVEKLISTMKALGDDLSSPKEHTHCWLVTMKLSCASCSTDTALLTLFGCLEHEVISLHSLWLLDWLVSVDNKLLKLLKKHCPLRSNPRQSLWSVSNHNLMTSEYGPPQMWSLSINLGWRELCESRRKTNLYTRDSQSFRTHGVLVESISMAGLLEAYPM